MCTYKELAKKIGSPKAVRAVGSALRNNPFAPKVPCHRVVSSDRTLGEIKFIEILFCFLLSQKEIVNIFRRF